MLMSRFAEKPFQRTADQVTLVAKPDADLSRRMPSWETQPFKTSAITLSPPLSVRQFWTSCMNTVICEAISKREVLAFRYGGGERVVEPYRRGKSTGGSEVLRAYR